MAHFQIRRVASSISVGLLCFVLGFGLRHLMVSSESPSPLLSGLSDIVEPPPPNPYPAYSFANLEKAAFRPQPITLVEILDSDPAFTSYLVEWDVPDLVEGKSQRVTGQMNLPTGTGPFPIIVMNRGYVEREQYQTGIGTRNGAAAFARNGYITIAPDFLGYAGSDPEPDDGLLARFQRPVTVLQLLKNLESLSILNEIVPPSPAPGEVLETPVVNAPLFATDRIGMWGHSNGGQISLSVLEILNRRIPTTLWAPVSKPFPYSVMYYTDESPDGGKYLRQQLAWFEGTLKNSVDEYTILQHPERIIGPVQIHQGGNDDAIPLDWSQDLATILENEEIDTTLYIYPDADHNLQPDWNAVIQRDLTFFARELKGN
jgi:dienelactone hydrolase